MELFAGDKSVIEEDIKRLIECINCSKNQTESLHIYSAIQTLSYFYQFFDPREYSYFKKETLNFKNFINRQNDNHNKKHKQAINNFIKNKDVHNSFIDELIEDKEIAYPFISISEFNDYSLDDYQMYEILRDFLSIYNIGSEQLLDELIKEKRFHKVNLVGDTRGYTIVDAYNEKLHVFFSDDEDLNSLVALAHEFGHVIDFNNLFTNPSKKALYGYYNKSLFLETISSLYEKDFTSFLIDEKVYPNASRKYLVDYYANMYDFFDYAKVVCSLPDNLIMKEKYKRISKDKLKIALCNNPEIEIYTDCLPHPNELDMFSDLEYGYGIFLATYFSYLRKHDASKFNDQFNNFLNIRTDYFRPDFLEYIGTNRSDAIKIVEEEINSSTGKVIVKKK